MVYKAYGTERTSTADGREKFGTYFRDGTGFDYAEQRYYGHEGAFLSPDPGGIGAAHKGNPISWNRYIYANDDPINRFDPSGRFGQAAETGQILVDPCEFSVYVDGILISNDPGCAQPAAPGFPVVGGGIGGTGIGNGLAGLIADSRSRVEEILEDHESCASAIGASSVAAAEITASGISISASSGQAGVGKQSLGPFTLEPDGSFTPGQAEAVYSPNLKSITLNANIDWSDGTTVACLVNGAGCQTVNLAQGEAARVGADAMSANEFMDLTLLHEMAHSFGLNHPGTNGVNDTAGFNKAIWTACFE
jgi:RHS repeat-associated protein